MSETVKAIDESIAKIIRNVTSSKFWFNAIPVILGALTVIESGGDWLQAVIGALMVLAGAGNYTYSKLRQNIEYIRTHPQDNTKPHVVPQLEQKEETTEQEPDTGDVDWLLFDSKVTDKVREIKQTVPNAVDSFALYNAILSVGRDFKVNNIDDLKIYSNMLYMAALDWWKEVSGFDYWEAVKNGVPYEFWGICGSPNLDLWIRANNPSEKKPIVMAIKDAYNKMQKVYHLDNSIFNRYLDWQRTLNYVWSTLLQ